jgi:PhoH-like ATPase
MTSIHAFRGNNVVIPIEVLDELDRFKDKKGLLGESARYVNRYLDRIRELGTLATGVTDEETDITYRVALGPIGKKSHSMLQGVDMSLADNRIVARVHQISSESHESKVTLVTKDINLRVKCDSLGVSAQDYYSDYVDMDEKTDNYLNTGLFRLREMGDEAVSKFFEHGNDGLSIDSVPVEAGISQLTVPNALVTGRSGDDSGASFIARTDAHCQKLLPIPNLGEQIGIKPRDKEQSFALWALLDPKVPLVTITGAPGSGKTYLTLMSGIDRLLNGAYERVVITRVIQPVGRSLGFLPGDIQDKMDPWLAPIVDNFRHAYKDLTYFDSLRDKGQIEIAPLAFIRGRSFHKSFIIVDEAQNATIHELKTILTRAGEGSKVVLMGDVDQIDTPYIDRLSNGLTIVIDKFLKSKQSAHVHLRRGHRSDLANEASALL